MAIDIENTIKKVGGRLLESIYVFDYYAGDKIDSDKKSLAFKLTFADSSRTLEEKEVMDIFNKIITEVTNKHNAILRDK